MKRLLLLALTLPLLAIADDAQPLGTTAITAGVGYNNSLSKHAIPWANYMHSTTTVAGFTLYMGGDVQVTGVATHPLQLQTVFTAEVCPLRSLGEYLVVGGCGVGGVSADGTNYGGAMGGDAVVKYRFGKSQHWSAVLRTGVLHSAIGGTIRPDARLGVGYEFGK